MLFERKDVNLTDFNSPADVVIKCSDKDVHTHRILLAALSKWFSHIFQISETDEEFLTIILKDFSSLEILPLLDFVYRRCDSLNVSSSVIKELYLDIFDKDFSARKSVKHSTQEVTEPKHEPLDENKIKLKSDEDFLVDTTDKSFFDTENLEDDQIYEDFFQEEVKLEPDLNLEINSKDDLENEKSAKRKRKSTKLKTKSKRLKEEDRELDAAFEKEGFNFEDDHCHICDTDFRDNKAFRRHVYNVHAPKKTFKCEHCDYVATKDPGKLRIHMAMNHGGETMKCNMCNYETPILKYLIKHKKKMHEGLRYKCDQCDHTTNHKQLLQQHIKVKHEGFKLSCDQCLYTTGDPGALKKHRLNKHEGVVYPCDECSYVANAANNLNRHKRVKHQEAEFLCDRCDYKTGDKGCLKEHQQIKHEGLLFRCEECDYSTKARSSLRVHKETVHLGITYPCEDCEYTAKTRKDLRYHRARKHDEAKYKCDLCDYGVAAISLLNQHIMFKHEGKKIYCDVCPYFATSAQAVNKHKLKKHDII